MKIEKMCSKQDVVQNLKKAAKYSQVEHLGQLAEYIQQEIELDNLKSTVSLCHYEVKVTKGGYQLVKLKTTYDEAENRWLKEEEEVIETILFSDLEKIVY